MWFTKEYSLFVKVCVDSLGMSMFNNAMRGMHALHLGLQDDYKCRQITLDIQILKNIFPLHTKIKTHDT